jgi:hypothetical protein
MDRKTLKVQPRHLVFFDRMSQGDSVQFHENASAVIGTGLT